MKRIKDVSKVFTLWYTYFDDHVLGKDEDLSKVPSLIFDNKDQAIGSAMTVLMITKGIYYACVIEVTKYVDDEEIYNECIWEASAEDDTSSDLFSSTTNQFS